MEKQPITTLRNLLDFDARRFISAEVQLKKSLPQWTGMATSVKLKGILQKYHDMAEQHIQMMQFFFEEEHINSLEVHNRIMQAYIDETEDLLHACTDAAITDCCLLASIQSVNHFKISMYGTAAAFATMLELEKAAAVFHEASTNEKHIDDRLSQLAEFEINVSAKTAIELQR